MRLIDADALHDDLRTKQKWIVKREDKHNEGYTYDQVHFAIDDQPTVDAVPVRRGKWLDLETLKRPWFRHHIFECSVCKNTLDMDGVNAGRGDANYCPNCGARMDERKEE